MNASAYTWECIHRHTHTHANIYIRIFSVHLSPNSAWEGLLVATPQQQKAHQAKDHSF